jgi:tetratricopeptide (TPR) repeat protein
MPVLAALLLGVGLVVLVTHWPVLSARAVTFDDRQYLTDNHLVRAPSWSSATQIFREVLEPSTVHGYYQPLTMISLMLDWARGGRPDNLTPFHHTSLALHVLNSLLVVVFLYVVFGRAWAAALIGLLFGVHPMTVEPVAWLSERKTLLAAFFTLWCLILYVSWTRKADWRLYGGTLGAFVLALLCKPTSTPLPALLLLLDYWPLRRLRWRAVVEKVPLVVIAAVSAVITIISQGRTAALAMPYEYSAWRIPLTICHNMVFYLHKIAWPTSLSSHYPFPRPFDLSSPALLAGVIGTALLLVGLVVSLRWTRAVLAGWLFFFVALFPTLGVIGFTHVIAADKYAYLPAIGLLLILAWLTAPAWSARPPQLRPTAWRVGALVVLMSLAGLAMAGTRRQLVYWQDTESLYHHMLALAPQDATLHSGLGDELTRQGRLDEAIGQYEAALRTNRDCYDALNGLGIALLRQNRHAEAAAQFEAALRLDPQRGAAYGGLGSVLARQGRTEEAFAYFEKSLELDPHIADVHNNMGAILARRGEFEQAIEHYTAALRLKPESARAHHNLGVALVRVGQLDRAAGCFREAIRLEGDYLSAHGNLGFVLLLQGKFDEAIRVYEAALRIAPDDARLQAGLQEALSRRAAGREPNP